MTQKPEAYVVHALPGRVRFRVAEKKGDRGYFEELLAALSKCSGLEQLVINPTTASVLIHYSVEYTGELNGFLGMNNFFQLVERTKDPPVTMKEGQGKPGASRDLPRLVGLGLVGLSCVQLMRHGLTSPPWHAALWYGYTLLSKHPPDTAAQTGIAAEE